MMDFLHYQSKQSLLSPGLEQIHRVNTTSVSSEKHQDLLRH